MDEMMIGEKPGQYIAYLAYRETGDLESGYKKYMQDNLQAGLSFKGFMKLASDFHWIVRSNDYHQAEELRLRQDQRRKSLYNNVKAEDVAKELYTTCMEEMDLNKGSMTHNDIAKYLSIANNITVNKNDPLVVVSQAQSQGVVEIDDSVLRELGKKLVAENDSD